MLNGFGRPRLILGGRSAAKAERLALAIAFKIAREGAQARELAQKRPAARAKSPPRRQKGAQIRRREARECGKRGRLAEMRRREVQELPQIARV